jgi:hypothetical protein
MAEPQPLRPVPEAFFLFSGAFFVSGRQETNMNMQKMNQYDRFLCDLN